MTRVSHKKRTKWPDALYILSFSWRWVQNCVHFFFFFLTLCCIFPGCGWRRISRFKKFTPSTQRRRRLATHHGAFFSFCFSSGIFREHKRRCTINAVLLSCVCFSLFSLGPSSFFPSSTLPDGFLFLLVQMRSRAQHPIIRPLYVNSLRMLISHASSSSSSSCSFAGRPIYTVCAYGGMGLCYCG